ncbi:RNA polymerase sigma factor [Porphyromonas loveana]
MFTMSHFGRYSNGEIAERLGLTEGNVRVILSRLRKEAKEVIGHEA